MSVPVSRLRYFVVGMSLLMMVPQIAQAQAPDQPTAANLAARESFRRMRFGIFIHWGVYSVLGRGEWVMNNDQMSVVAYEPVAEKFNPTRFNAKQWVSQFKDAGAEYMTITSKHHDGFALWDSAASDWDIVDRTPYARDVLADLSAECQQQGLKLFFYHSHLDWHHPDYFPRGRTGNHSERAEQGDFNRYLDYMDQQLTELLSGRYGRVAGIWFDGWWDQQAKGLGRPDASPDETNIDWRLQQTYDLIHRLQPDCLVGNNHHVRPFAGEDFQMFERDLPGENSTGFSEDAQISELPLETCDTINGSWGYNAADKNYKPTRELIHYLVRAAGRDANFLLNIGPLPDGTIDEHSATRLREIGEWMRTNGQTIKGTRGGPIAPQAWGVATQTDEFVYLHILDASSKTDDGWLTLAGTQAVDASRVSRTQDGKAVAWRRDGDGLLSVQLGDAVDPIDTILALTGS